MFICVLRPKTMSWTPDKSPHGSTISFLGSSPVCEYLYMGPKVPNIMWSMASKRAALGIGWQVDVCSLPCGPTSLGKNDSLSSLPSETCMSQGGRGGKGKEGRYEGRGETTGMNKLEREQGRGCLPCIPFRAHLSPQCSAVGRKCNSGTSAFFHSVS